MGPSSFMTYTVPGPWPTRDGGVVVARAPRSSPIRVVIKNQGDGNGAGNVFLAFDQNDLISASGPSARVYLLTPGFETVLVIAKDQKIFAIGDAARISVSVAINEAFPIEGGKSAL